MGLKEENEMSTMPDDDINARVEAGRQAIELARDDEEIEPRRVPPAVVAAGVGAAIVGLGLIGWLIYRSRRRRTLLQQVHATLPGRVSELRELGLGLRDRGLELGQEMRGRGGELRDELRSRLKKAL
jgi:hypothetical protein